MASTDRPSVARTRARRVLMAVVAFVLLCLLWEGYKAFGEAVDGEVLGWRLPARYDDTSMPHVWDVWSRFTEPEQRASERSVGLAVLEGAWYTFRVAMAGFVLGVAVGLLLAVVMQRFAMAERGLLPFVIISQTVPLVALAPLVVGWGGQLRLGPLEWERWMSVAWIASYLAFFPVAVGALRGLQSPTSAQVELMRSYAASEGQTLLRLRFPSSVPYLLPALKLGAASSVIGAIVAEISTGVRGGIGRLIIEYSREATSDPAKVFTAMIGAALLGLFVAGLIGLLDLALNRHRPKEVVP